MRGACSHGARCRFSHDASVIGAARVSYQPQGAREIWAQKWSQRASPGRSGDPPARINDNTSIAGAWILAEDLWTICEQTEGKCFLRHVKCQGDCACALCQAPHGLDVGVPLATPNPCASRGGTRLKKGQSCETKSPQRTILYIILDRRFTPVSMVQSYFRFSTMPFHRTWPKSDGVVYRCFRR